MKQKMLTHCLDAIMCVSFAACGSNETNKTESSVEVPKETNDSKYYFKDGVMQAEDVKIEITDYKIIQPGEKGNEYSQKPVIAFWYNTTNLSDHELNSLVWLDFFTAIQDNDPNIINELQVGSLPDERFSYTQTESIKPGGTAPSAIAYELDDTTTPVTLKAIKGYDGIELGEQIFNLTSE